MGIRLRNSFQQLSYLVYEIGLIVNDRPWRWFTSWFGGSTGVIVSYRLDRFCYLLFGQSWALLRLLFFPVFFVLRMLSASHEIHYRACIGKGLQILHPSLGTVVSAHALIGEHLTLTGGNCIGERQPGELIIGNHVTLGANAVVLGPVKIGNGVKVGAGAVVLSNACENEVMVGVPAHPAKS